jgi:hypothetical protein
MAKSKRQSTDLKIVEHNEKVVEIPKITRADHIRAFQLAKDEMYYPATGFHLRQLSTANARVTAISAFATFFLATAITLGMGALQGGPSDKPWLPFVLGGFSTMSIALTAWSWIYRRILKREVGEIIDEILRSKPLNPRHESQ